MPSRLVPWNIIKVQLNFKSIGRMRIPRAETAVQNERTHTRPAVKRSRRLSPAARTVNKASFRFIRLRDLRTGNALLPSVRVLMIETAPTVRAPHGNTAGLQAREALLPSHQNDTGLLMLSIVPGACTRAGNDGCIRMKHFSRLRSSRNRPHDAPSSMARLSRVLVGIHPPVDHLVERRRLPPNGRMVHRQANAEIHLVGLVAPIEIR